MPKEFVISDLHFGHATMLREDVCDRPYDTVAEMNEAMIAAWNAVVDEDDTVYVLGDVIMNMQDRLVKRLLTRLNGRKILVRGNHDPDYLVNMKGVWAEVHSYLELPSTDERPHTILFHYPIENWNRKRYGSVHLHGHEHGDGPTMKNRFDVGWDNIGPAPIELLEAVRRAQNIAPEPEPEDGYSMQP